MLPASNFFKKSLTQVSSCEFSGISNKTFLMEHLWTIPSELSALFKQTFHSAPLFWEFSEQLFFQVLVSSNYTALYSKASLSNTSKASDDPKQTSMLPSCFCKAASVTLFNLLQWDFTTVIFEGGFAFFSAQLFTYGSTDNF